MTPRRSLRALRTLSSALLLALLVTAIHPMPAFAEEGAPPPDPAGETAVPAETPAAPAEEAAPAPEAPAEAPALPAEDPAADAPAAGEAAAEAAPAEAVVAEALAAAPDGTTVAVADAQGEAVPLVSGEAEAIAAGADPIWCPAAVKAPTPNLNGCSPSAASLTELRTWLTTPGNVNADGVIWFEAGYDSGVGADTGLNFSFNGSSGGEYEFMSSYRLTLRGGWDGIAGSKVITPVDVTDATPAGTTFRGYLWFTNWNADVTLTDIVFTGITGGDALQVTQQANSPGGITLTRVVSHNNSNQGAYLRAEQGTGKVSISDSRFRQNGSSGMYVTAKGAITLANVVASANELYGARLDNNYPGATGAVTLTGASTFSDNHSTGLYVASRGAITANDLTAERNGLLDSSGSGVEINNSFPDVSAGVKLTGLNILSGNYNTGLTVYSRGAIALNSVVASANQHGYGAYISNQDADPVAQPVTLSGTNAMRYNGDTGLTVYSKGKITLNSVTANGNGSYGGYIVNTYTTADKPSDVLLTGSGVFHDNASSGFYVSSYGVITAANLSADRNGAYGASLTNSGALTAKAVTLTGTNAFHDNVSSNLSLSSHGAVTLSNLTASGSTDGTGASIYNTGAPSAQKVTLSGTNVFEDNRYSGLEVYSFGAISVSGLRAHRNGLTDFGYGADLNNNTTTFGAQPVTLTGSAFASGNYSSGLYVRSLGNITAANVTANGSLHGAGANLNNSSSTTAGGVTLTGTNLFNDNLSNGLFVQSRGLVKLSSLTASRTVAGPGINIDNTSAAADAPKDVLLSGTHTFEGNSGNGASIYSEGAITLSSTTAYGNGTGGGGNGVYLTNAGVGPKPITLSGVFAFNKNVSNGLSAYSLGAIKVNAATANGNGGNGLSLDNSGLDAVGGITLTGVTTANANTSAGLSLYSRGAVAAAGVTATDNGSYGAYVDNDDAGESAGAATVTFSGTNVFTDNHYDGLYVQSVRAITVANLTASRTVDGHGASLTNNGGFGSGGVTLSGVSRFEDNDSDGLLVSSKGAITAGAITASGNGGGGASLRNDGASTAQPVKLTGAGVFNDNAGDGLYIYTVGAVSAVGLTASGNDPGFGARIANEAADPAQPVTLGGTNAFNNNRYGGLVVSSLGAITLNSVSASDNGAGSSYTGAEIRNASGTQPIKLTGTNTFSGNTYRGLDLASRGSITLSNLTASDNGYDGAYLWHHDLGTVGSVTLSGANTFRDNSNVGLWIQSLGAITLNSVTASGNSAGAWLRNHDAASAQALKLTGTNAFDDNSTYGMRVWSMGAVTINNLTARGNLAGNGAEVDNSYGGSSAGITLTGTNLFNDNGANGLSLFSYGAVSLTKVTADANSSRGLSITGPVASLTLTCGSLTSNGTHGIYAESSGLIKLIGVVSSGNADTLTAPDTEFVRTCPLP